MAYVKQTFKDKTSTEAGTVLKAEHLNHIEEGIKELDERPELPKATEEDEGKVLRCAGGAWEPGELPISWDDLADKPFYDDTKVYFEYTDGYTPLEMVAMDDEGKMFLYKISETPLSVEELTGAISVIKADDTGSGVFEEVAGEITEDLITILDTCYLVDTAGVISAIEDTEMDGLSVSAGLWISYGASAYVSKLYKENIVKLPAKYIPDEVYEEIDARISACIEEVLGGEY